MEAPEARATPRHRLSPAEADRSLHRGFLCARVDARRRNRRRNTSIQSRRRRRATASAGTIGHPISALRAHPRPTEPIRSCPRDRSLDRRKYGALGKSGYQRSTHPALRAPLLLEGTAGADIWYFPPLSPRPNVLYADQLSLDSRTSMDGLTRDGGPPDAASGPSSPPRPRRPVIPSTKRGGANAPGCVGFQLAHGIRTRRRRGLRMGACRSSTTHPALRAPLLLEGIRKHGLFWRLEVWRLEFSVRPNPPRPSATPLGRGDRRERDL